MQPLDNPLTEYFMYIVCILVKIVVIPMPPTARIKAIKLSAKTEVEKKVPNSSFSICYIKCLLVTALESNYSLIAV